MFTTNNPCGTTSFEESTKIRKGDVTMKKVIKDGLSETEGAEPLLNIYG